MQNEVVVFANSLQMEKPKNCQPSTFKELGWKSEVTFS